MNKAQIPPRYPTVIHGVLSGADIERRGRRASLPTRGRPSSSGRIFHPKFNKEGSEGIEFRKDGFFCSYPRGQAPKECDVDILVTKRRVHSKFK